MMPGAGVECVSWEDCFEREWKLTGDGETTETPSLLEGTGFTDSGLAGDDDGVGNEAVLESLDLGNHLGLLVGRAVVVNDTQTTLQSHVDGHLVLGDGVHGRGDEGGLEGDSLCYGRIKGNIGGGETNVARQEEEIIVGEASSQLGVHQVLDAQTIAALVLLEEVEGGGVVEDLGRAIDAVGGRHRV